MGTETKNYKSFIFTHIPKCGGTSFRQYINEAALASNIKPDNIYIPGFNNLGNDKNLPQLNDKELKDLQGKKIKILANHCKYGENKGMGIEPAKPFHFTILRDPVKRFISHYHFFYYTLGYNDCKGIGLDKLSEKKFISLLDKLGNIQIGYLSNIKFKKVVGLENMLKIAKYNIQYEFDSFGIVEDMKTTIKQLDETMPDWLNLSGNFPILNKSNSKKVNLSKQTLERIKKANKYDIDLYKFAKDLFYNTKKSAD